MQPSYIFQQTLGMKVSNKFFLPLCFLAPEITNNVHFLCIISLFYLVELKIDSRLYFLGAGSWEEGKWNNFFFNLVAEEVYRFGLGFIFLLEVFEESQGRFLCCHIFRVKESGWRLGRTVWVFSLLASAEALLEPAITAC